MSSEPTDDLGREGSVRAGLCAVCVHHRRVVTRRSTFYLCERSGSDRAFPRYPELPVLECPGWEPLDRGSAVE